MKRGMLVVRLVVQLLVRIKTIQTAGYRAAGPLVVRLVHKTGQWVVRWSGFFRTGPVDQPGKLPFFECRGGPPGPGTCFRLQKRVDSGRHAVLDLPPVTTGQVVEIEQALAPILRRVT